MSEHFDDKALINHFFPFTLPFSNDLLRIILDYLYQREITSFDKNGVMTRLRFGPVLVSNQLAYEIRAYNELKSYVFSTFAIDDAPLAVSIFKELKTQIINGKVWDDVFYWDTKHYHRYIYSPVSDHTYVIHGPDFWNNVVIYRAYYAWIRHGINGVKDYENMKRVVKKYSSLIVKYGEDWDKYPPLKTYACDVEDYSMNVIS